MEDNDDEFLKNPIGFVTQNFEFKDILTSLKRPEHAYYDVTFKARNGYVKARYSKSGELLRIFQKFENTALPREIMHEIYRDYKGWEVISNRSFTTLKRNSYNKTVYRIILKNGDKTMKVKIPLESNHSPEVLNI